MSLVIPRTRKILAQRSLPGQIVERRSTPNIRTVYISRNGFWAEELSVARNPDVVSECPDRYRDLLCRLESRTSIYLSECDMSMTSECKTSLPNLSM